LEALEPRAGEPTAESLSRVRAFEDELRKRQTAAKRALRIIRLKTVAGLVGAGIAVAIGVFIYDFYLAKQLIVLGEEDRIEMEADLRRWGASTERAELMASGEDAALGSVISVDFCKFQFSQLANDSTPPLITRQSLGLDTATQEKYDSESIYTQELLLEQREKVQRYFSYFDSDGDGSISFKEFYAGYALAVLVRVTSSLAAHHTRQHFCEFYFR
jgi:hypothetical protein